MSANTNPIFALTPVITWSGAITTANTAKDGTGTAPTIYTAGVNGSRVEGIRVIHLGTNVATVVRVFINNGLTSGTPANNVLFAEIPVMANTLSENAGQVITDYLFTNGLIIPAGYKLNVTIGTTISAGINVTAYGGDF